MDRYMLVEADATDTSREQLKTTITRFLVVAALGIAFAYIESAVVVYLRAIFHPDGFTFPLADVDVILNNKRILLTEIGREAATIVLILAGAWLAGRSRQERFAYFLTIFAVWDIFYYVWLKVLINWPASVLDWDILFLIPSTWASAVFYPLLISLTILVFAAAILCRCSRGRPVRASGLDWLGFCLASLLIVVSFCIAGQHITAEDFQSYFYWPIFALGYLSAVALFLKCLLKSP
jgi:hypothetical protein